MLLALLLIIFSFRSLAEEDQCVVDTRKKECAAGLRQSFAIKPSKTGGLRDECGKNATIRFLSSDAMTGAIIEWCNTKEVSPASLPVSSCGETRIGAIVIHDESLFYTTGQSLRVAQHSSDTEIAGVYGEIEIIGERLGTRPEELLDVRIRGQTCGAWFWQNSSRILCQVLNPALVGPNAPPLSTGCVTVTTRYGGLGGLKQRWQADLDVATYGAVAAPPAIFALRYKTSPLALRPTGLAFGRNESELFFSSISSGRIFPSAEAVFRLFIKDATIPTLAEMWITDSPRILALASDQQRFWYADAYRNRLAVREISAPPGPSKNDRTVAPIPEPRSFAFDPSLLTQIYISSGRDILRLTITDAWLHNASEILQPEPIIIGSLHAAPDGLVVLPLAANDQLIGDRSKRLIWVDANRQAIQAATRHGTRRINLLDAQLRFPRAITYSNNDLYVGEWLGRIFKFSSSNSFLVRGNRDQNNQEGISTFQKFILRSDSSTAAASTIRATLDTEDLDRQRLKKLL